MYHLRLWEQHVPLPHGFPEHVLYKSGTLRRTALRPLTPKTLGWKGTNSMRLDPWVVIIFCWSLSLFPAPVCIFYFFNLSNSNSLLITTVLLTSAHGLIFSLIHVEASFTNPFITHWWRFRDGLDISGWYAIVLYIAWCLCFLVVFCLFSWFLISITLIFYFISVFKPLLSQFSSPFHCVLLSCQLGLNHNIHLYLILNGKHLLQLCICSEIDLC